jgi:WD40 repeat protein
MYQQGKTTLWRPPDLQLAINWRDQQKPSLTWAERYDPAFERAMVYLRTSEKEYLAEEENKIMLQKRQIRRVKIVAMVVGGAAILSLGFMLFAFIQKIAADNQRKEAERQKIEAETQKSNAVKQQTLAEIARKAADSSAIVATNNEAEAKRQKIQADSARKVADAQRAEAQRQRGIAVVQSDSAEKARGRAVLSKEEADRQRVAADTRRRLSIGKAMAIKSLQAQGQKDLQTLLAYQAYLFNQKNGGDENDADIYMGLYNVAKQYGNAYYKVLTGHKDEIKSIAFIPGSSELYTSGIDGKIIKWNLNSKVQNYQVIDSGTIVEVLAVSPDAGWLACGTRNSVIKMIPLKGNNIRYELRGHSGNIKSLLFSLDSKSLYSAALDGKVFKWDLTSKTSANITPAGLQITSIDISTKGNYLAGLGTDGKVLVWNPAISSDNFKIEAAGKVINTVRFKPDDNLIAVGYTDGYIELWDITTHKRISEMKAHNAKVYDIQFNNKYFQMATASGDKSLKLWDTRNLTIPPITFNDNEGYVMVIGFSPDGQVIISGAYEGTINLVGRPTYVGLMAQDICSILTRNFTAEEWSTYVAKDIQYEKTCTDKDFNIKVNAIR